MCKIYLRNPSKEEFLQMRFDDPDFSDQYGARQYKKYLEEEGGYEN